MASRVHTVGVISDTHGLLRPEAVAALAGVERIVHAGDIGDRAVLEALGRLAPVTAVRGNNDRGAWARDNFGNWEYECVPGGARQRELAFRMGINLVMYALCLDYKSDQVHVEYIMRRRRCRFCTSIRCGSSKRRSPFATISPVRWALSFWCTPMRRRRGPSIRSCTARPSTPRSCAPSL